MVLPTSILLCFSVDQDMAMQTPTQELISKDLHGFEWRFKHIYRGMQISVFSSVIY
jgi:hypothetical protein